MAERSLNKKEREEIERLFKCQRGKDRVLIVERLQAEADESTKDIDTKLNPLIVKQKELEKKINELEKEKQSVLKSKLLHDFDERGRYSCSTKKLHPDLEAYDQETSKMLIDLITQKTVPIDVKAVLQKALES